MVFPPLTSGLAIVQVILGRSKVDPLSSMAPTLDVGGGSGLVAVNRGLRTCSGSGLLWAWWVRPWVAVNLVLAGFVTFG